MTLTKTIKTRLWLLALCAALGPLPVGAMALLNMRDALLEAARVDYADSGLGDLERKITLQNKRIDDVRPQRQALQRQIDDIAARFSTADLDTLSMQLQGQLNMLDNELADSKLLADVAKRALAEKRDTPLARLAVGDTILQGLLNEQRAQERAINQLSRRYGEGAQVMRDAREQLQSIKNEINQYADLLRQNTVEIPNFARNAESPTLTVDQTFVSVLEQKIEQYERRRAQMTATAEDVYTARTQINQLEGEIANVGVTIAQAQLELDRLQRQRLATGSSDFKAYAMGPAGVDNDSRSRMALIGGVGGASLPLGVLLLLGLFDTGTRFKYSDDQSSQMHGLTLLGILPDLPDRLSDPEQANIAGHCVHQIRTMLQLQAPADTKLAYAITSATSGDGKTSLCLAMGLSFAAAGSKTLMIDSDLVGQGLSDRLGLGESAEFGLLEALADPAQMDRVTHPTDVDGLALLPVGHAEGQAAGSISPQAMRALVAEAKKRYDIVVIDSGPILGSIEATPVVASADGVILTVSRNQQKGLVDKALAHLNAVGAKVTGVVFNRAQESDFEQSVNGMSIKSVAASKPSTNGTRHEALSSNGVGAN